MGDKYDHRVPGHCPFVFNGRLFCFCPKCSPNIHGNPKHQTKQAMSFPLPSSFASVAPAKNATMQEASPTHRPLQYTTHIHGDKTLQGPVDTPTAKLRNYENRHLDRISLRGEGADSNVLRSLQPEPSELDDTLWVAMMHATDPRDDHYGALFHRGVLQRLKYIILSSNLATLVYRWLLRANVPYHIPGVTDTPEYTLLEDLEPINTIYTEIAFFVHKKEWQERKSMYSAYAAAGYQEGNQKRARSNSHETNFTDLGLFPPLDLEPEPDHTV